MNYMELDDYLKIEDIKNLEEKNLPKKVFKTRKYVGEKVRLLDYLMLLNFDIYYLNRDENNFCQINQSHTPMFCTEIISELYKNLNTQGLVDLLNQLESYYDYEIPKYKKYKNNPFYELLTEKTTTYLDIWTVAPYCELIINELKKRDDLDNVSKNFENVIGGWINNDNLDDNDDNKFLMIDLFMLINTDNVNVKEWKDKVFFKCEGNFNYLKPLLSLIDVINGMEDQKDIEAIKQYKIFKKSLTNYSENLFEEVMIVLEEIKKKIKKLNSHKYEDLLMEWLDEAPINDEIETMNNPVLKMNMAFLKNESNKNMINLKRESIGFIKKINETELKNYFEIFERGEDIYITGIIPFGKKENFERDLKNIVEKLFKKMEYYNSVSKEDLENYIEKIIQETLVSVTDKKNKKIKF